MERIDPKIGNRHITKCILSYFTNMRLNVGLIITDSLFIFFRIKCARIEGEKHVPIECDSDP